MGDIAGTAYHALNTRALELPRLRTVGDLFGGLARAQKLVHEGYDGGVVCRSQAGHGGKKLMFDLNTLLQNPRMRAGKLLRFLSARLQIRQDLVEKLILNQLHHGLGGH